VTDLAERIIETMGAIHGVHPGHRAVHAKGSCCRGTFIASPEAATVTRAPHLQGDEIPVTVRFSNGSGRPTRADGARDERGMAVKFHLPDGSSTDIVSLTLPAFFVRNPEDFLAFLESQRPDPETGKPDMDRVGAFVADHPETQKALGFLMLSMSPASFANCSFNGIHAFLFTNSDGRQRYGRYRWTTDAGDATLTEDETRALGKGYLHEELEQRLRAGPMRYELQLQIGEDEDDPNDPTLPWPEERDLITLGHLTLTEYAALECDHMIFDPGNVSDGIDPSDDPILHIRSDAYSISFARRTSS